MENEKIFVVVPVYKVEAYLERCVDSILNQTYTNWELVLVDDGSPDNSGAICDRYAAEYENITVIHQENGGLSAARNAGIDYAMKQGDPENDWISFIDSDDYVHPRYLEILRDAAAETGLSISSCTYVRNSALKFDAVPNEKPRCMTPEQYWCTSFTNANVAWGKLYRLAVFRNIRYPVGRIYEDIFTTHKILFPFKHIAAADARLYCWYINKDSITVSQWTPSRIDQIDAAEAQLAYMRANGFTQASVRSARYLLWSCVKALKEVRRLSPAYDNLLPELETRKMKALRLYAEEVGWIRAGVYWLMAGYIAPAVQRFQKESKRDEAADNLS